MDESEKSFSTKTKAICYFYQWRTPPVRSEERNLNISPTNKSFSLWPFHEPKLMVFLNQNIEDKVFFIYIYETLSPNVLEWIQQLFLRWVRCKHDYNYQCMTHDLNSRNFWHIYISNILSICLSLKISLNP